MLSHKVFVNTVYGLCSPHAYECVCAYIFSFVFIMHSIYTCILFICRFLFNISFLFMLLKQCEFPTAWRLKAYLILFYLTLSNQFNFSFIRAKETWIVALMCSCKLIWLFHGGFLLLHSSSAHWIMILSWFQSASPQGQLLLFWGFSAHFTPKLVPLWDTEIISMLLVVVYYHSNRCGRGWTRLVKVHNYFPDILSCWLFSMLPCNEVLVLP